MAANPLAPGANPLVPGFSRGMATLALITAFADASGVRQQVTTLTFAASVENAAVYSVRVLSTTPGITFDTTYTVTTASTDGEDLRDQILAEMQADDQLGRLVASLTTVSTTQIVMTFAMTSSSSVSANVTDPLDPGTDITVSTVAAGWTQYLFAQAVQIGQSGITNPTIAGGGTITWDLTTNNNSQAITASFTVQAPDGSISIVNVSATSSSTAALTTDAIIAAFTSAFPLATVAETTPDDVVTVTLPPGYSAVRTAFSTGTVVATLVTAVGSPLTEIGIVHDDMHTAPTEAASGPTLDPVGPRPGTYVSVVRPNGGGAEYLVPLASGTPVQGAPVYVDTSGGWHAAMAAGRRIAPRLRWGAPISSTSYANIAGV
jgi:hypothetical protein